MGLRVTRHFLLPNHQGPMGYDLGGGAFAEAGEWEGSGCRSRAWLGHSRTSLAVRVSYFRHFWGLLFHFSGKLSLAHVWEPVRRSPTFPERKPRGDG